MKKTINKIFGEEVMTEQWPERDNLEFGSLHGDEACLECGVECDSEYCHLCSPHTES